MRISSFILCIQISCAATIFAEPLHAQTIKIDINKAPIKEVFVAIEKQAAVNFAYNEVELKDLPQVSLKISAPLEAVLKSLSEQLPIRFKQAGAIIAVSRIVKAKPPQPFQKISERPVPPLTVTGKITDENNNPLPGATIKVQGTNLGTLADAEGNFRLENLSANSVIIISFTGYVIKEINLEGRSSISVHLSVANSKLDEVHVIAYGTTTERLSTGSITKVNSAEIEKQPVSNPLAALEGQVPGLVITQSNGSPGSAFKVQLEGQNAMSTNAAIAKATVNSNPLFIIDGVPFAPNNGDINQIFSAASNFSTGQLGLSPFNLINPADIESIEVLKDADATAIYGSRGAYGVILITTKKGKAGKTSVNATVNSGLSSVTRTMDMLKTSQYLQMRQEAFKNDGITPTVTNAPDLLTYDPNSYTDWKKQFIGNTSHTTDAEATISGGNENTRFIVGGGYHHETTVLPGDNGDARASVHFTLNNSSNDKKFNTQLTALYTSDINKILVSDLTNWTDLPPNYPALRDASGNLFWTYNNVPLALSNPLSYLKDTYQAQTNNLLANLMLSYNIINGLTFKTSLGYNNIQVNEVETIPSIAQDPSVGTVTGSSQFGSNSFGSWIIEPQAEYIKNISKGRLDVLAGGTWQQSTNNTATISGNGYTSDALLQSQSAAATITASNTQTLYHYEAIFGRINYNWDDKYILNISGRRDGSSRFGPGKQFGNFGAVGGAWIFSKEQIFANTFPFLSFGKLRGSYGITGSDQIGDYQFLETWKSTSNPYQGTSGLFPNRLPNSDFSWETNKKLSVAMDLGFFRDRILINANYYYNRSSNHLINYTLPTQTGFTGVIENFPATVQNNGLELQLTSKNIVSKTFNWSSSFSLTIPKNKLVSFTGLATSSYSGVYVIGQPLNVINGLQYQGVNSQTGIMQFKDQNGDNVINANDFVTDGNLDPKFYGALQNTFTYKNWAFSFFFEFRKQMGLNYLASIYNSSSVPGFIFNEPVAVLNRWQNPGDVTNIPRFTQSTGSTAYVAESNFINYNNSGKYSDASFIRLKNLYAAYSLPSAWLKKYGVANFRIYIQGQNLLTITHYQGSDPESQNFYALPPLKTITAGLQITL